MTRSRDEEETEPVEVMCLRKVRETDKAALYVLADGDQKWMPKSVVVDEDEMDDGTVLLRVALWFAEKEALT